MAIREESVNNYTYLVVKHHSLCEESKEPRNGFEEVEVFNPKTKEKLIKYIDKWTGGITGYITDIVYYNTEDKYDTTFQGFKINIDDEVIVDLPHKTPAYDTFCKLAENIDFTKKVTLAAYHNKTKDRTGFSVKQEGTNVEWKYTQEHMYDCPPWEKDEDGEWDSRKQRSFLKAKVIDEVIPKCKEAQAERTGVVVDDTPSGEFPMEVMEAAASSSGKTKAKKKALTEDDIPF